MSIRNKIFFNQEWHIALLALLGVSVNTLTSRFPALLQGTCSGLSAGAWLWIGVVATVLHQIYTTLIRRLEMETGWLSRNLPGAFTKAYLADIVLFYLARVGALICLAAATRHGFILSANCRFGIAVLVFFTACLLLWKEYRYFRLKRIAGTDLLCRGERPAAVMDTGTVNGPGLGLGQAAVQMLFFIPGLAAASPAGLLLAVFYALSGLVFYFCTERPDRLR